MKLLLESMTKYQVGDLAVRVWREETLNADPERTLAIFNKRDMDDLIEKYTVVSVIGPLKLAKALIALPRVNAVEVLDPGGDGVVLYRDWP